MYGCVMLLECDDWLNIQPIYSCHKHCRFTLYLNYNTAVTVTLYNYNYEKTIVAAKLTN